MRIDWLNKEKNDRVVIFFNGWGMDAAAVSHLEKQEDILMAYDYRNLQNITFPDLRTYREIYIVAWSMGVWAASFILPRLHLNPVACIAVNGTARPVDDVYGIPVKPYELTQKGMGEKGREKFFMRMLNDGEERIRFAKNQPSRPITEQCEELGCIRQSSTGHIDKLEWQKAYVSEKDVIFPVENQLNYWKERGVDVRMLEGGHYPFYRFLSWDAIIRG